MSPKLFTTVVCALSLAACHPREDKSAAPPARPPVPVTTAVASEESVPEEVRAIGSVEPAATVQIKSQIAGELMAIHFVEGGNVKKGDLLFEIDPRPYQDALRQAESTVTRDRAQLRQAEANLSKDQAQWNNTQNLATRYESLHKEGVVSREQSEQMRTNEQSAQQAVRADSAGIESARASVETDLAAVERAKLDLTYCQIRSPISGRAGNLLVHPGNLVKVSDVPLVVINQIEPIFVSFGVPQQYLAAIRSNSAVRKLPIHVSLQESPDKGAQGVLAVIDNTVDNTTGTIRLKGAFNNAEHNLWPGQLVNATLTLDTMSHVTMVPSEAVQAGQQGQFVYVVKADQTVERRDVTTGAVLNKRIAIQKGVAPGETVVIDGQLLLGPGAHIRPVGGA